jgi:hypothetical protein
VRRKQQVLLLMDALPSQRSGSAEGVGALPAVPNPTANRW